MSEWKEIKLGDCLDKIIGGGTPSKSKPEYWNGDVFWCSVKDMASGKLKLSMTEDRISELGLKNSSSKLIQKGSVITSTRMGLGRVFINEVDMAINQDLKALIPNKLIDNNFLLQTILIKAVELESLGTGSTVKGITLDTLKGIKILLPPLPTQKRIASILSAYDDLIENNLKRIKFLEELAQRTYEEWFVKFRINGEQLEVGENGLPDGWEKKSLHEVAYINKNSLKKGFVEKLKYIDISTVSPGKINYVTQYDFEDAPGRARRILNHGDIIWSCVRPNRKSYSIIWNPEENLIASTGFTVISPRDLPTSYLYQYLKTESFVGYLTSMATGAAYPAVTTNVFSEAEIIIPKSEYIDLFDKKIKSSIEIISNLQNQNRLLKESRDILLPRLMSGKIVVESEVLGMVAEPSEEYRK